LGTPAGGPPARFTFPVRRLPRPEAATGAQAVTRLDDLHQFSC
jgi:hypothetical protein